MGGKNVKSTILQRGLELLAPHLCSGCQLIGTPLCDNCKYDIISEPFWGCIACGLPARSGVCECHALPFTRAWVVSERSPVLKELIHKYKFEYGKGYAASLASLLDASLPLLPHSTVLVPLPSVPGRVRQRGYDHTGLLVRQLGVLREALVESVLTRRGSTVQHFLGRQERLEAVQGAYALAEGAVVDSSKIYLLIDDVVTTGATIAAAAKVLADAGATVWVAALAYQPLD